METGSRGGHPVARRGGLRTRLLILFLIPVMLLGLSGLLMLPSSQRGNPHDAAGGSVGPLFPIFFLAALLLAAGLALHAGDRIARPVAWLLRVLDAGEAAPVERPPRPVADWEMELLSRKVQVLLKQNVSGARAVEELETLRSEISAIIESAGADRPHGRPWSEVRATHVLTRCLLDFFRTHAESLRDANDGLARLQGLLEQDWREETLSIEEIAKRSERCFLEQTELAMELQRLARSARGDEGDRAGQEDAQAVLADLRLGIERWQREVQAVLEAAPLVMAGGPAMGPAPAPGVSERFADWTRWVDESLELLEKTVDGGGQDDTVSLRSIVPRIKQVAETATRAGQELGRLSREAAQLERTWQRLGERLRSLMTRIGEVHAGPEGADSLEEGGAGRDRAQ
ncbi:MAG: hypothetical protein V1774_08550 [Candidatus Eisenbacteria bacterium]